MLRWGQTAPPRARQFLKVVNSSPGSTSFICKPTNPQPTPSTTFSNQPIHSPHLQLPFRLGSHSQGHCYPALITPVPSTKQQGASLMPQSPPKLLKRANPKPASLPHLLLPRETTIKVLPLGFSSLPLALTDLSASPPSPAWPATQALSREL